MNTLSSDQMILLAIIVIAVVGVLGFFLARRQRTMTLRKKFGPEYDRAVAKHHSRSKAEAELLRRQERVAQLKIVELSPTDARRFTVAWEALQTRFVDNPRSAVTDAEQLVQEVMHKRGYPVGEFESLAADLSVRYPNVVSNYRAARLLATRSAEQADTEELRKALVHYRSLFDELLGAPQESTAPRTVHRVAVQS